MSSKRFSIKECQQLRHLLDQKSTKSEDQKKTKKKEKRRHFGSAAERSGQLSVRLHSRLSSSRFRSINEFLYSHRSSEVFESYMTSDLFQTYHEIYEQIAQKWPQRPVEHVIARLRTLVSDDSVVADIGCGSRPLVKEAFPQTSVHSFDLVANPSIGITAANMTSLPLEDKCLDFALFSLSLMNTDLKECFLETNRVLRDGTGVVIIVEVVSRFQQNSIQHFCGLLSRFGFKLTHKQHLPPNHFFVCLEFRKKRSISLNASKSLPEVTLKPCFYKKR